MVKVGCMLPHGLVLEFGKPGDEDYHQVQLQGKLDARRGAKFGTTDVDDKDWLIWVSANNTLRYLIDGSVFLLQGTQRINALTLKPLPPL